MAKKKKKKKRAAAARRRRLQEEEGDERGGRVETDSSGNEGTDTEATRTEGADATLVGERVDLACPAKRAQWFVSGSRNSSRPAQPGEHVLLELRLTVPIQYPRNAPCTYAMGACE